MGLLKHLLFWPVTGPTFLARFSLDKVVDTVRGELTSDQSVKEDLLALQMRLELGDIDDEQYVREEALLMQRLRDVRHWREEFGMGTSGGPVRVAQTTGDDVSGDDLPASGAAPADVDDTLPTNASRGGIASPEGATIEVDFDWEG